MVEYLEGYRPGILGRIVELHGVYYGRIWGPVPTFEAKVAAGLADFHLNFQAGRDLLLTAWEGEELIGSIILDGSESENTGARIRFYIVAESQMGKGVGRELIRRATEFSLKNGHRSIFLWTVRGLSQSFALYEKQGYAVVEEHPSDVYGFMQTHLRMEKQLA
jgi:GNAT superfamily N-acetyltransferase